MGFREGMDFHTLLKLQSTLRYMGYDRLNLRHLTPLRFEVDFEVERLIAESKARKETSQ